MTLVADERPNSALVSISVPIRVLSFDLENLETGGFSEDTHTLTINQSGASIPLRNAVATGDFLRIVSLTTYAEADFRVVGAMGKTQNGTPIWGIECPERRTNFWGVESPLPNSGNAEATLCLQCRACASKLYHVATPMEFEVINCTGAITLECHDCGKPTYWVDPNRPPSEFLNEEAVAPPPRTQQRKPRTKRSQLKFPILIRNEAGTQEISKTIDMSKLGASVPLFMKLNVGETVTIVCPYDSRLGGIEQKAKVRWRSPYCTADFPRVHGLCFIR